MFSRILVSAFSITFLAAAIATFSAGGAVAQTNQMAPGGGAPPPIKQVR